MPNLPEEIKNHKDSSPFGGSPEGRRYIPLAEAGEILGTSRDYLNVLVRRGKLRAVKLGRNWFTTGEWISEYKAPAGKLEWEEKAELASLREISLAERLERVESEFVSLRDISRREKNIQTFKDREISKQISTVIASQEIKLPSRTLEPEEKLKILEAAGQRSRTFDSNQFHNVSKKLGISGSLKSWSAKKLSIASGLAGILLLASLGMATGILDFSPAEKQFSRLAGQASIFSNALKNFPGDIPQFSGWLAGGIKKSISFFNPSQTDLTIEELESGKPKIAVEEEFPSSVDSLAQAEALDAQAMEESPFFAETPEGRQTGLPAQSGGSSFSLFENRLSLVESNLEDQAALINSELSIQKKTILGVIKTIFGIAELVPRHPGSTIVVQGQPATLTTYSIAPQVQSGFDRLSATSLSLASDATINGSLTVESGGSFNSLSVSGSTSLSTLTLTSLTSTGDIVIGGTLAVTGTTTVDDLTVNGTINIPGNSVFGNSSTTNATLTNFWSTNGTITNGIITNGTIANASTTYATIPTFWGTNGTIANLTNTNASSTNLTATNFWSTNGTITNASTTYLTVGNNFWGAEGLFSGAVQTPLIWNNGTLTASTTGANPIIFATNSSERMKIDANGYVAIGTTTIPSGFGFNVATSTFTYGNQFISGGLGVGIATTTGGALQTSGNVSIGGSLYVSGDSTVLGDSTVIGGSFTDTLTVNSAISSDLVPSVNNTYDLGSTSYYWDKAYVNTLTVNSISAASTTIGGTQSETFTINSDNATSDTETETLIFFRGTIVPNALLTWNAATSSKRFEFNQTLYINNGSASTTNPTLTIKSIANQTANALQILDNNSSAYFTVNPVGNNTTMINASTTNLTVSGNLWSASNSTSTFNGAILLSNGSATAPSLAFVNDTQTGLYKLSTSNMGFVTAGLDRLTIDSGGNVGIGTTTPNNLLTIYKSQSGGTNLSVYNPTTTGYTSLILGSDSTSASSSISFYNASYPTSGLAGSLELRTGSSNDILIRSGRYTGVGTAITSPQATIDIGTSDAYNNTIVDEAIIRHNTTGTAGNGLGAALSFWGQAAEGTNQQLARISGVVEQASTTDGFASYLSFWTVGSAGIQEKMRLTSVGGLGLATTTMPSGYGANIATSTYVYGNLTVSGNSIFNNSSTTNATLTNFWSTNGTIANGTITNASTTYATIPTFWSSSANITGGTITGITDLTVADGGTGASTLTDHGVLIGSGTDPITALSVGTNGQLLVGSTGADPVFAALNCANGLTCTTGAGTLQVDFDGGDSPGGSLGGTWASPTIDDLFILNTGDIGTGSYTFPNASSTYGTITDFWATNATTTTFRSSGLATFGGNVGIGTASPGYTLDLFSESATVSAILALRSKDTAAGSPPFSAIDFRTSTTGNVVSAWPAARIVAGFDGENYSDARLTFQYPDVIGTYTDAMSIKNSFVGIGTTTPGNFLSVHSTGNVYFGGNLTVSGNSIFNNSSTTNSTLTNFWSTNGTIANASSTYGTITDFWTTNATTTTFRAGGLATFGGNVGIGTTTPSAKLDVVGNIALNTPILENWTSTFDVLQIGGRSSYMDQNNAYTYVNNNAYYDGASWKYQDTAGASHYRQNEGEHTFWVAPSGTADTAITFTQAMTITNTGNVGIGTTTPISGRLVVQGSGTDSTAAGLNVTDSSGISKLYVRNDGNVGIGTTGPEGTLHVHTNNAGVVTADGGSDDLIVENSGSSAGMSLLAPDAGDSRMVFGSPSDALGAMLRWNYNNMILEVGTQNASGQVQFVSANGANAMRIDTSGNIGIGTTSPKAKLQIGNQAALGTDGTDSWVADNLYYSGGWKYITSSFGSMVYMQDGNVDLYTAPSGTTDAAATMTSRLTVLNGGNVGIGTSTPWAKLSVLATDNSSDNQFLVASSTATSLIVNKYGNVGIGTAGPGGKLDVYGDSVWIYNAAGDASGRILFNENPSTYGFSLLYAGSANPTIDGTAFTAAANTFNIFRHDNSAAGVAAMTIERTTGNVGIGTTGPDGTLHVHTATAGAVTADANANDLVVENSGAGGISILTPAASDGNLFFGNESENATARITREATTGDLKFSFQSGAGVFRFQQNGNMGIGTTTPGSKLSVSGGVSVGQNYGVAAPSNGMIIEGNVGIGTAGPGYKFQVAKALSSSQIISVYDTTSAAIDVGGGIGFEGNYTGSSPSTYGVIFGKKENATAGEDSGYLSFHTNKNPTGNAERMRITSLGNVGIGTTTPGAYNLNINGTGYLNTSAWVYASDIRLKENISYLGGGLDKILQLKPAKFDYIIGEKNQLGFIAQDVQGVIPEAVIFNENSGMYGLKSDFIIPYLVTAIQELNAKMASSTIATSTLQAGNGTIDLTTLNADLNLNGFSILNVKSIAGINNLWSIDSEGNIIAKSVQTQALTVGGGAASGITVYDRQTSTPKCIYIEGGAIMSSDGACGATTNTGTPAEIIPASDPVPPADSTSSPQATSTPPISETIPATASSTSDIIPDAATTTPEIIAATSTPETATSTP